MEQEGLTFSGTRELVHVGPVEPPSLLCQEEMWGVGDVSRGALPFLCFSPPGAESLPHQEQGLPSYDRKEQRSAGSLDEPANRVGPRASAEKPRKAPRGPHVSCCSAGMLQRAVGKGCWGRAKCMDLCVTTEDNTGDPGAVPEGQAGLRVERRGESGPAGGGKSGSLRESSQGV